MVAPRKRVTAPDLRFPDEKLNRLMEYVKFLERELHKVQRVLDLGTSGQVLTKTSDRTYDAAWADATGGGGGADADGNNLGTGTGEVFKITMAGVLQFRTLKEGANITITQDGEEVTIEATSSISVAWDDITGKPATFPPSAHGHAASVITYFNGTSGLTATDVQGAIDEIVSGGGSGYTDENAQDAVGNVLVDSASIDFTYSDVTPSITATVIMGSLVIDWTQITSGVPAMVTDLATIGDPNADRIMFWDDSAGSGGSLEWLTVGSGLVITGTTLSASGGFTSPLTTKGDIHVYDSADARLAIGPDDTVLISDSSQSAGLRWVDRFYRDKVELLLSFEGANNATTTTDESPAVRTITFNGNAKISTSQSKFGSSSLQLDGTGDYLSIASRPILTTATNFTIECWVRPDVNNRLQTIAAKRPGAGAEEYSFQVDATGKLVFSGFSGGSSVVSITGTTVLSTATWYHVAVSVHDLYCRIFVNGTLENSGAASAAISTGTNLLLIGRDAINTGRDWQGFIDEFRFTAVCRYVASFTPATAAFPRV